MVYGVRGTLPTISGDLTANSLQMLAAALGLGAIVTQSESVFLVLKWCGVAYLAWLGISRIRRASTARLGSMEPGPRVSVRVRYAQGFLTSASNPKAVVFFAALFPQFIDPTSGLALQLVVLGVTFLVLDGLAVAVYASTSNRLAQRLSIGGRMERQERVTGAVLLGAAGLLALKGAPSR